MVIAIVGIYLLIRLYESALGEPAAGWSPLRGGGFRLPQERLPVRKIKEVLRLHALGLSQRQIALSCSVGQATVSEYLKASEAAKLKWPDVADWDDDRLYQAIAPSRQAPPSRKHSPEPDYAAIRQELQTNKHVTLQLLWEEYRNQHPDGYRYSRFCDLYRGWLRRQEVVLRQEHRAGEKLFVDYAGATVPIHNAETGEVWQAAIFVAVLGASSYTYAEASLTQGLAHWIGAHMNAFEFLGGVPEIVVPDNLKSGVTKPCRYEPGINRTYEEMAAHYDVAVVPARPAKPRDKAKVEAGVLLVERWILAALRKRKFFTLSELNQAIAELLVRLNERPFRKREGCRRGLFERLDQPVLRALPVERYQYGDWETHRVNIDYHVAFDHHWYSVPYQLTQQEVEVRATAATVEIFHRGVRIASHARSHEPHAATTVSEHRPKAHQRYLEWTPSRLVDWAKTIGPATADLFDRILAAKRHPEQGFRSCLGILRLGKQYSRPRLEAAAHRAVALKACSYQSVKSILKCNLDSQPIEPAAPLKPPLNHPNIRGSEYFDTGEPPILQ
jgi:transposase